MKERKYLAILIAVTLAYLAVQVFGPVQHQWNITLNHRDKDPYGTYVLRELMPGLFPHKTVRLSNLTAYEWLDSVATPCNFITLTIVFNPAPEDVNALLNHVSTGAQLLIAAEYFHGIFADTLGISTGAPIVYLSETDEKKPDSMGIYIQNRIFRFHREHTRAYFTAWPSDSVEIVAFNEENNPVFIRINKGRGAIWLSSTPLAFTNINLLHAHNADFAEHCLLHLPPEHVLWTEYYYLGRGEPSTPLRYILSTQPLAWAYYITMGSVLLFMLFSARRKQRAIPVVSSGPYR